MQLTWDKGNLFSFLPYTSFWADFPYPKCTSELLAYEAFWDGVEYFQIVFLELFLFVMINKALKGILPISIRVL